MHFKNISVQSSIRDLNAKISITVTVTDWPYEWQTENASKVTIFNIEIFFYETVFTDCIPEFLTVKSGQSQPGFSSSLFLSWSTKNLAKVFTLCPVPNGISGGPDPVILQPGSAALSSSNSFRLFFERLDPDHRRIRSSQSPFESAVLVYLTY